jgi:hypothetical protein
VRCWETGRFTVALSGGPTMPGFFRLLAQEPFRRQIPLEKDLRISGGMSVTSHRIPPTATSRLAWDHLLVPGPGEPKSSVSHDERSRDRRRRG